MLITYYCKQCGKEFYPTPDHVYKDDDGLYCSWTCLCRHRDHINRHRKRVYVLDKDDNVLTFYPSAKYAADVFRCSEKSIQNACRTGQSYQGYHWRYADDNKQKGEK